MIIPTFQKGARLAAADLNLAMDAVRRARVLPGAGIKLTETVNGTVVSVKPQRMSAQGNTTKLIAWDIINLTGIGEPNEEGKYSNYEASIVPGSVNSVLATNWWNSNDKTLQKFTYSGDTITYFYLDVQADTTGVLSCNIVVTNTQFAPNKASKGAPPSQFYITLGIVFNESVYQITRGTITAETAVLYAVQDGQGKMDAICIWSYRGS